MSIAGLDGVNGDTMDGVGEEWWLEARRRGMDLVFEPEVFFGKKTFLQVLLFQATIITCLVGPDVLGLLGL